MCSSDLPFVAEEVWRWWNDSSVHVAPWPTHGELLAGVDTTGDHERFLDSVCGVLALIRRSKTEAKVSQRAEVESLVVSGPADAIAAVDSSIGDLVLAGTVRSHSISAGGDEITASVTLAPTPAAEN